MRKLLLAAGIVLAPVTAAQAQSMPLSTFLAKADALQKKGPMALFSNDFTLLKKEVTQSGKALRAEENAALKAGQKPATCMPDKVSVGSSELLAHFRSIPPAQRGMSVKSAFASLVAKKYPCPA